MASLLSYVFREVAYVDAKLSVSELQRTLTSVAPGIDLCESAMKANGNKFQFEKSTFLDTKEILLSHLALDSTVDHILIEEKKNLFGNVNVKIKSITLSKLVSSGRKIIADLTINFDSQRFLRSIVNKFIIQSRDIGANNIQLTGCKTSNKSSGSSSVAPGSGDDMSEEECDASGGTWVSTSSASGPPFCSFDSDILEWY